MDPQEDLIHRGIPLTVILPWGQKTTAVVHGSKPVMDVLVTLCAQYHLVPSAHVIKLISTNQNHVNFKPNSMIGSLEFEKVVLQSKGNDANKKKPHVPVATVCLLINYKKSHKAVVRVNPAVPLMVLMPTVCEKCEFNPDDTILLKTYQSEEPLNLTKSLNEYGIREVYAKEMKDPAVDTVSAHKGDEEEQKTPVKEKNHREKGNKGFFGLFKKNKKTPEQAVTDNVSASPELNGQRADTVNGLNGHSTLPDLSKKRCAPRPPMMPSQSVAYELHTRDFSDLSESDPGEKQDLLSQISSTESSLKRTKRRAPPPPCDDPTPSNSDNKVDKSQGDDKHSDKYRARIADLCPAITKVMSELVESLQERQQRKLSSEDSPISLNQPAEDPFAGLFSEHHTPEAELKALTGCQLLRSPSEREGLTTFMVVPRRPQQSQQCFEVSLTSQSPDATKDLSPVDPDALDAPITEPSEEVPSEPFRNGGKGSDKSEHLEVLQHLEKENQPWTDVESENLEMKDEEDQCIHPKNIEREGLEALQRGLNNLERVDGKMDSLKLRDSGASPSKPANKLSDSTPVDPNTGLVVREEINVQVEEEKDWVEQYKERRRKFLDGGDDDGVKQLDVWGRIQKENAVKEMDFPLPPPPVNWDEDSGENGSEQEMQNEMFCEDVDQWASANSKPKYVPHHSTPNPHPTQIETKPSTSGAENNCISTPEFHKTLFLSQSCASFDPSSRKAEVSLFALAVFQKAKRSKPGLDLNCSRRQELPVHTQ